MKNKIHLVLVALALAVATHGYLILHYYPLHFGISTGESLCNIGAKFNCDAVSVSPYSSISGIPLAAFGAAFNLFLFFLVLLSWWTQGSEKLWRASFWLSLFSVGISVGMGSVSAFLLSSFCLFCLFAYGLSAIAALGLLWVQPSSPWSHLKSDITSLFTEHRGFLMSLLLIPAGAGLTHFAMVQNYGADKLSEAIKTSIADWQSSPVSQWSATPALAKGASPEAAKMTIAEFADFRCGHCRMAAPSLDAFVAAHLSDVRLLFFTWPLDGQCNSAVGSGDGISCELARAALCAGRQNQGWETHEKIFANQPLFQRLTTKDSVLSELKRLLKDHGINWDQLTACINDPQTEELIKAQVKQGLDAKIQGTPAIFVNGRQLSRGQVIQVLEAAREKILESK